MFETKLDSSFTCPVYTGDLAEDTSEIPLTESAKDFVKEQAKERIESLRANTPDPEYDVVSPNAYIDEQLGTLFHILTENEYTEFCRANALYELVHSRLSEANYWLNKALERMDKTNQPF